MQSDGFGVTNTAWAAQYVAMTGENTSAVSLFLLNDVTYTIEARLNEFGFPGNLINSITYVADRYGMQDVPLIVPNHVSAFWIVVKGVTSTPESIGVTQIGQKPYGYNYVTTVNSGASWTIINRNMTFITKERQ
jgi:hypothetical protein